MTWKTISLQSIYYKYYSTTTLLVMLLFRIMFNFFKPSRQIEKSSSFSIAVHEKVLQSNSSHCWRHNPSLQDSPFQIKQIFFLKKHPLFVITACKIKSNCPKARLHILFSHKQSFMNALWPLLQQQMFSTAKTRLDFVSSKIPWKLLSVHKNDPSS